jgi:hypothetical protein
MKPLFKCELNYFPSTHLSQIYDGFEKLRKLGIIDLVIKQERGSYAKPILKVVVDDRNIVIYDTLDGLNWIDGSLEDNLIYFKNSIKADYYFKRSFNNSVSSNSPKGCKVFPLGFNYDITQEGNFSTRLNDLIKYCVKSSYAFSKYYQKNQFYSKVFESLPIGMHDNKVLFLARLWDPSEGGLEHLKQEREIINQNRIDCIKTCQREFGADFVGGIQIDAFSLKYARDLLLDDSFTNRASFLDKIKIHNICIATNGLHDSIGWKFGEYVAASRAVITEPLKYQLPGDFNVSENYLEFKNTNELIEKIHFLMSSRDEMHKIMNNNFRYYNSYLRPEMLILNTLLIVSNND